MTEYSSSNDFEYRVQQAINIPQPRPEFVNQLYSQLMQQAEEKSPHRRQFIGMRPGWAISLVAAFVLVTGVLLIGPKNVQATFKRLLGYLPGMGIVEQSSQIRILEEPVSQTRDGVAVTISQAVLTEIETRIEYSVYGVPLSAYPDIEDNPGCLEQPTLRLLDGTEIPADAPVPQDVDTVIFELSCLQDTLPGAAPENWELELHFIPAPPDFTLYPVIEVTLESTAAATPETPTKTASEEIPADGAIAVTQVIETEDGYILMGTVESLLSEGDWLLTTDITLIDATGKQISTTYPADVQFPDDSTQTNGGHAWAAAFKGAGVTFPLTIHFSGQVISQVAPDASASLMVDVGPTPQSGEEFAVNQQVELAGYPVELLSLSTLDSGYSFSIDPGTLMNVSVAIEGAQAMGGGGGGSGHGPYTTSIIFAELPVGPLTVVLSNPVVVREANIIAIEWHPETIWEFDTKSGVCLSADALLNAQDLPAKFSGMVVYSLPSPTWQIFTANLDGSHQQMIAENSNRSGLSADGTKMAYLTDNQLVIYDLTTEQETTLPGLSGYSVHWSPDGSRITFISTGEFYGILLVNADGSGQKRLSNLGNESLAGFSPDSTVLYYAIPGSGGSSFLLRSVVVETGDTQDLFLLDESSAKLPAPTISPDGQYVVYRGANPSMLYRKPLDGGPAELMAESPNNNPFLSPVWDASGQWIGISAYTDGNQDGEMFLFSPETCQVYRLPGMTGTLEGIRISEGSSIP